MRSRELITRPDALVLQDPTLLHQVSLFEGGQGQLPRPDQIGGPGRGLNIGEFAEGRPPGAVLTVPTTELAQKHLGRSVPSAALLGGFAALTGMFGIDSVRAAIQARFAGRSEVAEGNIRAVQAAFDYGAAKLAGLGVPVPALASRDVRTPALAGAKDGARSAQIEGFAGVAATVARCRPEVICAYPISPPTHFVEALSREVKSGRLAPCEFINVESEFAAMSVAIGASAARAPAAPAASLRDPCPATAESSSRRHRKPIGLRPEPANRPGEAGCSTPKARHPLARMRGRCRGKRKAHLRARLRSWMMAPRPGRAGLPPTALSLRTRRSATPAHRRSS
jgi:hypothetical protein